MQRDLYVARILSNYIFFPYLFLVDQGGPFLYLSSAASQRTAYSGVPSQMAAHPRIGSPLKAGEIAGLESGTVGLQSGVVTNEPPLLPVTIWIHSYTCMPID
jgi:hypothetical protein